MCAARRKQFLRLIRRPLTTNMHVSVPTYQRPSLVYREGGGLCISDALEVTFSTIAIRHTEVID